MKNLYIFFILLFPLASLGIFACVHSNDMEARVKKAPQGFALMEMFTSEGCSSCPPAYAVEDRLQTEFQKSDRDVIILDFHVDYWNYLGWKDPYSDSLFSERQKAYSVALKMPDIFTPQAFVNGKVEFVASVYQKGKTALQNAFDQKPDYSMKIKASVPSNGNVSLEWKLNKLPANAVMNIAITENSLTTHVLKGENAGKTLTHFHVVRQFTTLPLSSIKDKANLNYPSFNAKSGYKLVAFIQDKNTMEILAADSYPININ